jgi:Cdc6-like AAA superfamily ATPase
MSFIDELEKAKTGTNEEKVAFITQQHCYYTAILFELGKMLDKMLDGVSVYNGLLLYGDSCTGKTTFIRDYERRHPVQDGLEKYGLPLVIPLVVVNAPIKADVRLFYTSILEVLRIPVTARESITSLEEKIVTFTENYDVKIIAIDNLDNLLNGTQAKRLDVVNAIKNLQDRTTIKFVLIGRLESVCNKEISDTFGEQYKHLHIPKLLNDKNGEIVHFIDTITFGYLHLRVEFI